MQSGAAAVRGHHRAQHDGEFRIQGRGRFRSGAPTGGCYPTTSTQRNSARPVTPVEDDYADIPPGAATTRWIGDRLDRHYAISVLAHHRKKPADRAS